MVYILAVFFWVVLQKSRVRWKKVKLLNFHIKKNTVKANKLSLFFPDPSKNSPNFADKAKCYFFL